MHDERCIFCAIVAKKIPAKVVYEDERTIAFLDIRPRSKGMTLVVPKKHFETADGNEDEIVNTFATALKVARGIHEALSPLDISIAIMPSEIKHFHIRVYPYYKDEIPLMEAQPKEAKEEELEGTRQAIARAIEAIFSTEEKKEQPPEEKERSEEEVFWIRRELELA